MDGVIVIEHLKRSTTVLESFTGNYEGYEAGGNKSLSTSSSVYHWTHVQVHRSPPFRHGEAKLEKDGKSVVLARGVLLE